MEREEFAEVARRLQPRLLRYARMYLDSAAAEDVVQETLLGLWLDRHWPGDFSWTLALLLAGVTLGCLNAWYWVDMESRMIEKNEAEEATRP